MPNVKVFLSYNESADGGQVAQELHDELSKVHVDAVMARHAILPGADWEQAIRTELESSAALVSVGTKGYSTRPWCQQEIGWALGRHVPILWIQYTGGESPAGFLARTQALIPQEPNQPELIAKEVVQWLANQETTHNALVDGLLNALEASNSFRETRECAELLIMTGTLSAEKWSRVTHAATTNRQVRDAFEWVGEGHYRRKVAMLDWLKKRIGPLNT
ncbi:toll/interleukin-1 receptor domain-containing protein [Actinomyces ruminis]|uniref:Toll/interleukin-1 receptor domain-containing protein n=1 Tax=Actinomyces ruminis TaxID=1937003 RepID=A0ABX4M9V5_9ACTO|nr:toll/interleukin-1 receptor domain-containing protein [Actinomyces ruminis]PHP52206.1 toll/interleukin-1 receptor domain-containing protein [Actinomyces ruminis]